MRNELKESIINRIIEKEALHSDIAKYARKHQREEEFLIICYNQGHVGAFQEFLGEELFNDLINYNVEYNNKQKITFTQKQLTKTKP